MIPPFQEFSICLWPNREWCYSHSVERYQQESGLSDDYRMLDVLVYYEIINVDAYIDDLVLRGAL